MHVYIPVFKPNLIYRPAPSGCDFCHTIFFLCLVLPIQHFLVCHFTHGNPCSSHASSQSLHSCWLNGLSISWYQQLWEQMCEQYTWGQSPSQPHNKQGGRKIPRGDILSFSSSSELSNLEEVAKVGYWGKVGKNPAEAAPAVCTVCTQKYGKHTKGNEIQNDYTNYKYMFLCTRYCPKKLDCPQYHINHPKYNIHPPLSQMHLPKHNVGHPKNSNYKFDLRAQLSTPKEWTVGPLTVRPCFIGLW